MYSVIMLLKNLAGESGLVFRGYMKTGGGNKLVAVKTGKGMYTKYNSLDCVLATLYVTQHYFPRVTCNNWQKRCPQCCPLNTTM